jgi:hypothetical protein
VSEASNFGHGLQMWLQIAWFIARTSSEHVVVLDEPDVYMHHEQQLKLIELLKERFRQTIFSTHSTAIINSCDEDDLLRVHRKLPVSKHGIDAIAYESAIKKKADPSSGVEVGVEVEAVEEFYEIELRMVGYSSVSFWNRSDELVDSLECVSGKKVDLIELCPGRFKVSVVNSGNVEMYLGGRRCVWDRSDSDMDEFYIDVGGNG